jgi:hypothetical protein
MLCAGDDPIEQGQYPGKTTGLRFGSLARASMQCLSDPDDPPMVSRAGPAARVVETPPPVLASRGPYPNCDGA